MNKKTDRVMLKGYQKNEKMREDARYEINMAVQKKKHEQENRA